MGKRNSDGYLLGVDGGGTKTLAAVTNAQGQVLGVCKTEASNFQGIGTVRAGINLKEAVDGALENAGINPSEILFATYGIAGADREDDFDTVHSYVEPANPAGQYMICNDTTLALRAGTKAGIGVALIAGTGSNTIGFGPDFTQKKVGGLGPLTGDYGSGGDLAKKGVLAAMKYADGRGQKTLLYEMFCKELDLEKLEDIIEFFYIDKYMPLQIHKYAPLVFEAADRGDAVARGILKKTGREVGHEAVTCARALFKKDEPITFVLGGSIFMRGSNPLMIRELTAYIQKRFPLARIVKLKNEPCLGALMWSLDCYFGKTASQSLFTRTAASLKKAVASGVERTL